jgi:hypothetical protein
MLVIRDALIADECMTDDFRYILHTGFGSDGYTFYFDSKFGLLFWLKVGKDLPRHFNLDELPHRVYVEFSKMDVRLAFKTCLEGKISELERQIGWLKKDLTSL